MVKKGWMVIDFQNRKFVSSSAFGEKGSVNYSFKQYGHIVQGSFYRGEEHFGQIIGWINTLGVMNFTFSMRDRASMYHAGTGSIEIKNSYLIGKCFWSEGKLNLEDQFLLHEASS
ncbi:hypothetical protein [Mesobacillus foraminis]|nr:hypothetical protein [Mesobacillus foraminis]